MRSAPCQPGSVSSEAGARAAAAVRPTVARCIVQALEAAGPAGMTIEQLAAAVSRLRGRHTKEAAINGRICGDRPELGHAVTKTGRTRPNRSGVAAAVYMLRRFVGGMADQVPAGWREEFEERAAIAEYLGGLNRGQAESQAFLHVMRMARRADRRPEGPEVPAGARSCVRGAGNDFSASAPKTLDAGG